MPSRLCAPATARPRSRSEAVRDLIRNRLIEEEWVSCARGDAVATVTLVYDHSNRDLADRLLEVGHDNHGAIMASMHVHLDHDNCLEVIALREDPKNLRAIADHLIGMKGVKHNALFSSHARNGQSSKSFTRGVAEGRCEPGHLGDSGRYSRALSDAEVTQNFEAGP